MLRVAYSETNDGQRWTLFGRLMGPWVDELRSCWREGRERAPLAHAVVDLKDVTFIDEAGEALLGEMLSAGTECMAAGVAYRYLLDNLKNRNDCTLRCRPKNSTVHWADSEKPRDGEK